MRVGLAVSIVAHLLVLAWGLVSLHFADPVDINIEALPIELVDVTEVSSISVGDKTAERKPDPSPNDPSPKPAETPAPVPTPEAKPKPTPPPPPPPAETANAAPPPEPEPEAKPPEPSPPKDAVAEAVPDADTSPTEAPPEPAEKTATPPPLPRVRPDRPAPKPSAPAASPEKKDQFDPDRIAALLDKSDPASAPAPSEAPASLGVSSGNQSAALTLNELDALRAQVQRCWDIPTGWTDPREVSVVIRFRLNQDGTVNGVPTVVEFPASQYGQVSAENAIRAVLRCGPYQLPPEKYDQWSEVQIRFTPLG